MCELKMYTAVQVCLQELHRPTFNRDNAKVTIDLRRTSNLQNVLRSTQGFSWIRFTCEIVRLSVTVFVN